METKNGDRAEVPRIVSKHQPFTIFGSTLSTVVGEVTSSWMMMM